MKKLLICISLFISSCRPCSVPNPTLQTEFIQKECVEKCQGDLEEADLATWWEQFDDPCLTSLIERGLSCNYDLRIAREKICEARAVFGIDISKLFPYINYKLFFDRMRKSNTMHHNKPCGDPFANFYQTGFDSIWEIDLFGKNINRSEAAACDVAAAKSEVRNVHVSVASEIASLYFLIVSLQDRIAITKSHIAFESCLLEIVDARFRAGLTSELDVHLNKALLQERYSSLPRMEARFYQTIFALAVLVDETPEQMLCNFCDKKTMPCSTAKIPLGLPSDLLCRRGDVKRAEFQMLAAGARVLAARKELFPTISLKSLYSYATGFLSKWPEAESKLWNESPSIILPIFHGGEILSRIYARTSIQKQLVLTYEKKVLEALAEVESGLVCYFREGERLDSLQKQVAEYREARALAETLYTSGVTDFLYVVSSERNLFLSQIALSESQEMLMTQLVRVYKSLGGGWECF